MMGRRRRIARFGPGFVFLVVVLATPALFAATSGVTADEQRSVIELHKRLRKDRSQSLIRDFLSVYQRRAYRLDVDPAEAVAKKLVPAGKRIRQKDQRQYVLYFAWSLDALIRGANLKDVTSTVKKIQDEAYSGTDKDYFIEAFLGVASRYASPVPLVELTEAASYNGMVGRRRREFLAWAVDHVKRGENPAYIKQTYDVISRITPMSSAQREFLTKYCDAIRAGVPPLGLTGAVQALGKKHEGSRGLNEDMDRILRLFFSGRPLEKAVNTVIPPKKQAAPK